ncbi:MAG: hypothetical protein HYY17_13170 [Planctomycetes bacterium]|nr:hypothetical protein [Planctomycetota bacterium]
MYRKRCYQKLDEPVLVWPGVEFGELALSLAIGFGAGLCIGLFGLGFLGLVLGVPGGAAIAMGFKFLRRGGPGYFFSRVYRSGFLSLLPPGWALPHMIPAPLPGRPRRCHLSPIRGDEDHGKYFSQRYFGR